MISDADAPAFGDVVLVPFPFTNQVSEKRRPAVVISSAACNEGGPDVILMAITSRLGDARDHDLLVENWQEAGLLKPSAVKPVITTLEQALILRRLGTLAIGDRDAVTSSLRAILG